jgi:hypothetical protein
MCKDPDCTYPHCVEARKKDREAVTDKAPDYMRDPAEYSLKEKVAGLKGSGVRFEVSGSEAMAGRNQVSSPQYTPLLVMMMVELYCFPDRRSHYLYASLPQAQTEIMGLLRRAQIVVPRVVPSLPGAVPTWDVDEDALRAYVNAVCRVSLPEKLWVMR